jgi:hypothetical protein
MGSIRGATGATGATGAQGPAGSGAQMQTIDSNNLSLINDVGESSVVKDYYLDDANSSNLPYTGNCCGYLRTTRRTNNGNQSEQYLQLSYNANKGLINEAWIRYRNDVTGWSAWNLVQDSNELRLKTIANNSTGNFFEKNIDVYISTDTTDKEPPYVYLDTGSAKSFMTRGGLMVRGHRSTLTGNFNAVPKSGGMLDYYNVYGTAGWSGVSGYTRVNYQNAYSNNAAPYTYLGYSVVVAMIYIGSRSGTDYYARSCN